MARILLADDEKDFVDTLAERLELRGFTVRVAYDGVSALRAATGEKPDVVVLDMLMPGMSGDETLRRLKDIFPLLPVILLSGHEVVDDNGTGPVSQAFACLTKPLALDNLLETLTAAVRESANAADGEGS